MARPASPHHPPRRADFPARPRRANFGNRAANLRRYAYRVLLRSAAGDSRISRSRYIVSESNRENDHHGIGNAI